MPAINPQTLNEQIETIFASPLRAKVFSKELQNLLAGYADHSRRSTALASAFELGESLRVPAPVLRAVKLHLHQRGKGDADEWIESAHRLWHSELRELRQISVWMLAEVPPEEALEISTNWAVESDDPTVLQALAVEGIAGWRREDPELLLERTAMWITQNDRRAFGLFALLTIVEQGEFDHVPAIFSQIGGLIHSVRATDRDALQLLLENLAERFPPETTAFIKEELASGGGKMPPLIRSVVEKLPPAFRSELR